MLYVFVLFLSIFDMVYCLIRALAAKFCKLLDTIEYSVKVAYWNISVVWRCKFLSDDLLFQEVLLGRSEGCDIRIQLPVVSKEHAKLRVTVTDGQVGVGFLGLDSHYFSLGSSDGAVED